jgi:hypothetical protein
MGRSPQQVSYPMPHLPGFLAIAFLLAATASPLSAAKPERRTPADRAVERALDYLARKQPAQGRWESERRPGPAVSALVVMAFLSAGHLPGEGRYGDAVEKGLRFVLAAQQPNGVFSRDPRVAMYHHGIATLMLAEVAGMTRGPLADEVREKLEKAVALILRAQRTTGPAAGGWRYTVRGIDGDVSVTGWQLLALRAAKDLGCDVPPSSIERALKYIQSCRDPVTGGYCYQPHYSLTVACTGTAVLALEICGKDQHGKPELLQAGNYILKNPPWKDQYRAYATYYCTQAIHQLGDPLWKTYRSRLHEAVLRSQKADGSWTDNEVGPEFATAMAVLALTVDYGYLPIYQRGTDPAEKRKGK